MNNTERLVCVGIRGIIAISAVILTVVAACSGPAEKNGAFIAQGIMAGEVTQSGVILQSRLTATDGLKDGDVPGAAGTACFEVSTDSAFSHYLRTPSAHINPQFDYIVKIAVTTLRPGTRYYYRLFYGAETDTVRHRSNVGTFRTLDAPGVADTVKFAVVTGMNYSFFHHGRPDESSSAYKGTDRELGFPALEAIQSLSPDFFIGTGDNVYYDHPIDTRAKTAAEMRRKWHEQFVQKRFRDLFATVPTYWEKDDHDYRYNDADTTDVAGVGKPPEPETPSHSLGRWIFAEQMPVVYPGERDPKTFRTHRLNDLVQLWLVEGRDYRSPNAMPDGPGKSLWGTEQLEWLKRTLLESDAVFKVLVSPTPLVGPDDAYKTDNHTNPDGFRHEGEEFFRWLGENGFLGKNFYIICGDRHWQYHSVRPDGFEEFSCGALVDANSRLGRNPGDPESTDPVARITQLYTQSEASGGFLMVTVAPGNGSTPPAAAFTFRDEHGTVLYEAVKLAVMK